MIYVLECKDFRDDHEDKWIAWTRGSLDEVISDFFYLRDQTDTKGIRITWERNDG